MSNERELIRKLTRLVNTKYSGDWERAFNRYAGAGAEIDKDELKGLLKDAGIGSRLTRGLWVDGVMEKVDSNRDGKITWSEFESVTRRR